VVVSRSLSGDTDDSGIRAVLARQARGAVIPAGPDGGRVDAGPRAQAGNCWAGLDMAGPATANVAASPASAHHRATLRNFKQHLA
jgi:4-hydroxy-3-polyprenylbenzoate decarboxylase